jgi:YidC/Oxa1 family membrane protein insertase
MSTRRRSFDAVTILGLLAAAAIFLGVQMYVAGQQRQRAIAAEQERLLREAEERAAAGNAPRTEELRNPANPGGPRKDEPKKGETKAEAPPASNTEAPAAAAPVQEPAQIPADIRVVAERLDLTFTARGAGLAAAQLPDEKVTAWSPKPGLELLDEIEPGRLSLGLVSAHFAGVAYDGLEKRVWFLEQDSKGFDENKVWTLAYSTTLCEKAAPFRPQVKLVKRFRIGQGSRHVDLELEALNLTQAPARFDYALRGAAGILADGPPQDPKQGSYYYLKCALAGRSGGSEDPTIVFAYASDVASKPEEKRRISAEENFWGAVTNRFFTAALIARQPRQIVKIAAEPIRKGLRPDKPGDLRYQEDNICPVFWTTSTRELPPNGQAADGYAFYVGPIKDSILVDYEKTLALESPVRLNLLLQYCDVFSSNWPRLDALSRLLLWLFNGIASLTASYGLAVILLTLVIKLSLHPFQRKMTVSMHKLQRLQPRIKAIEEKYAGQTTQEAKQKKELEKLDLMRKEGANPMMGCLPMLVQMPIFFALYGCFCRAFEIRQAQFLWAKDLSLSDRLFTFGFWPQEFNLLPLIYIALTLYQGLTQPKPPNPDPQQEMNRKMMMFMPVFFGFLFYKMPSGLVLYFAASAVFGLLESWYVKRFVLKVDRHGNPLPGSQPAPAAKPAKA